MDSDLSGEPEHTAGRGGARRDGAGRGVPEVHSLHVNLPSGLRERPRQARWKAPQQGPSHSTRLPGFSHSCRRQGRETRCEKQNSTRSPDPQGSGAPAEGREEGRRGRAPRPAAQRPPAPHLTHVLLLGGHSSFRPFRRDGHFGLGFVRTLVWGLRGLVSGAIRDLGGKRRTTVHSGRQQPRQLPSHAATTGVRDNTLADKLCTNSETGSNPLDFWYTMCARGTRLNSLSPFLKSEVTFMKTQFGLVGDLRRAWGPRILAFLTRSAKGSTTLREGKQVNLQHAFVSSAGLGGAIVSLRPWSDGRRPGTRVLTEVRSRSSRLIAPVTDRPPVRLPPRGQVGRGHTLPPVPTAVRATGGETGTRSKCGDSRAVFRPSRLHLPAMSEAGLQPPLITVHGFFPHLTSNSKSLNRNQ